MSLVYFKKAILILTVFVSLLNSTDAISQTSPLLNSTDAASQTDNDKRIEFLKKKANTKFLFKNWFPFIEHIRRILPTFAMVLLYQKPIQQLSTLWGLNIIYLSLLIIFKAKRIFLKTVGSAGNS